MEIRPNITFFSFPKMLMRGLFVAVIIGALAWFWVEMLVVEYSITIGVVVSGIWFLLALWSWWVWNVRKRNGSWHQWLSSVAHVIYVSGYFWLAGVSFWYRALVQPINLVVVGLLISLYIFVLGLPILNYELAKKLHVLHDVIDRKIISFWGGTLLGAGIMGYWLQKVLEKDAWMIIVSILGPIVGLGLLQHQSFEAWLSRPWAKKDE